MGGDMKKLIIIFSIFFLSAVSLMAAQEGRPEPQRSDGNAAVTEDKGILKEIRVDELVIGGETFGLSNDLTCYSESNNRLRLSDFSVDDGVLFKVNAEGKIFYMKRIPH